MSTICSNGSRGIFAKFRVSLPHFGTIIGICPGRFRSRHPRPDNHVRVRLSVHASSPDVRPGCRPARTCPPGSIWRRFGPHRPSGTTHEPSGGPNRLKNGRRLVSTCQHPEAGGKASHRGRRHWDGVGPGIWDRVSLMGTVSGRSRPRRRDDLSGRGGFRVQNPGQRPARLPWASATCLAAKASYGPRFSGEPVWLTSSGASFCNQVGRIHSTHGKTQQDGFENAGRIPAEIL